MVGLINLAFYFFKFPRKMTLKNFVLYLVSHCVALKIAKFGDTLTGCLLRVPLPGPGIEPETEVSLITTWSKKT